MKEKGSANEQEQCSEQERYIHALELQVETFALLASRLASLLQPSRTEGTEDKLPYLRPTSRKGRSPMAAVEVALGTSGSKASTAPSRKTSKAPHPNKGKKLAWWKKLSEAEKAAIIAKRVAGARARREAA